jgi:hypothetical protein
VRRFIRLTTSYSGTSQLAIESEAIALISQNNLAREDAGTVSTSQLDIFFTVSNNETPTSPRIRVHVYHGKTINPAVAVE